MSILQGRTWRYGKTHDYKVSGSDGSGWERPCLDIHRCVAHVSEVCQWASALSAGEGLETVWGQFSRTTLANCIIYCSQNYFQPMYDNFQRELLKHSFAMVDETRVQVLREEVCKARIQSFMWLFRSGEDGLSVIILYGYFSTGNRNHAKKFLESYNGYLETDGYQGDNNL